MKIEHTIEMMQSDDYAERFKAEYFQLKIRIKGLEEMLVKYKEGTLPFKPKISYNFLNGQLKAMKLYYSILSERAEIENIELEE